MGDVSGSDGGNGLRCTSSRNCSLILVVVCGLLCAAIVSGVCWAAVLFKPANLHSRMEKECNVTTICCVDSVADGVADGNMISLLFCGRCKDEHV